MAETNARVCMLSSASSLLLFSIMTPLEVLEQNYPALVGCRDSILAAFALMAECYDHDGVIYTCGNGGSCADADHITGELLKGFCKKRPMSDADRETLRGCCDSLADYELLSNKLQCGLRGISLMAHHAAETAVSNDLGGTLGAAQQLFALGRKGDVMIAISTSGNAENIRYACEVAKLKGIKVIGMTGSKGGKLAELADVVIRVPADQTYRIQEYHLPIYHALCLMIEEKYFDK